MAIRRTLTVQHPPAKVLAALATAGENLGFTVRRADPRRGVIVMTSDWSEERTSLGFLATGRLEARAPPDVEVTVDLTPRLGFWALASAAETAEALFSELQHVLQAPKARIRRPDQAGRPDRPFAYRPEIGGAVWGLASLLVYGVLVGGWWWVPALAGALGGLLLALPSARRPWRVGVTLAALLSLPFGLVGFALRRESLAHAYWQRLPSHSDARKGVT